MFIPFLAIIILISTHFHEFRRARGSTTNPSRKRVKAQMMEQHGATPPGAKTRIPGPATRNPPGQAESHPRSCVLECKP